MILSISSKCIEWICFKQMFSTFVFIQIPSFFFWLKNVNSKEDSHCQSPQNCFTISRNDNINRFIELITVFPEIICLHFIMINANTGKKNSIDTLLELCFCLQRLSNEFLWKRSTELNNKNNRWSSIKYMASFPLYVTCYIRRHLLLTKFISSFSPAPHGK